MSEGVSKRSMDVEYTEFHNDSATIALLTDVTNERAWIQSTVSVDVEP